MELTAEIFENWAVELEGKVSGSRGEKSLVWVILAPFCAMWYNIYPQYLKGDKEGTSSKGMGARKPNEQFTSSRTV